MRGITCIESDVSDTEERKKFANSAAKLQPGARQKNRSGAMKKYLETTADKPFRESLYSLQTPIISSNCRA